MKGKLSFQYFMMNMKKFHEYYDYDLKFNAAFHHKEKLSKKDLKSYEMRYVRLFRLCQANEDRIWRYWYRFWFKKLCKKTGIGMYCDVQMGKGLVIGHYGRIVVNGGVKFGNDVMLTHNVTIGRDVRGKRKGTPTIGNRVVIRTNSTITGNVKIGDDVLIAPNTFVNFDVPDHSVVIGNPATIHPRENATEGHIGFVDTEE